MVRKGALAVALLAAALAPEALIETPLIPNPTTAGMESQVADKILSARNAVAENPSSDEAWGHLDMVFHAHYLELGAAPCDAEARRLDRHDFRWPYRLARILKSREPDRALEVLNDAHRLKRDYAPLYLLAAELHVTKGDSEAAMHSYRRALSVDRGSAAAEFGIGRLALAKDELEETGKHLERARELAPEAGSIQARPKAHPDLDVRDPILASVMDEAVSLVGYQTRALDAERASDPSRAEALLRRVIEIRPEDANLHYNLANHLSRRGRFQEAEDAGHLPTLVNLGILAAQNARVVEAKRLFEKALEKEPAHAGALLGLANAAAAEGRLDAAIPILERVLEAGSRSTRRTLCSRAGSRGSRGGRRSHWTLSERPRGSAGERRYPCVARRSLCQAR